MQICNLVGEDWRRENINKKGDYHRNFANLSNHKETEKIKNCMNMRVIFETEKHSSGVTSNK